MSLSKTCCPLLGAGSIQEDCSDKTEMNFIENKITKKEKKKRQSRREHHLCTVVHLKISNKIWHHINRKKSAKIDIRQLCVSNMGKYIRGPCCSQLGLNMDPCWKPQ